MTWFGNFSVVYAFRFLKQLNLSLRKVRDVCLFKDSIFRGINAHGIQETYLVVQSFQLQPNVSTSMY